MQVADALFIMTEWRASRRPGFLALKLDLREPVVSDGRNVYDPQ